MTADTPLSFLQDRLDIIELTAKHAFYVDTRRADLAAGLWSDSDAVFDEEAAGLKKTVGKKAIKDYLESEVLGKLDATCHHTSNNIVENITATTATGHCTVIMECDVKGGGPARATAYYEDEYVREDGRWKFSSRKVIPLTKIQFGDYKVD
jgi:hypothetical protein